MSSESTQATLKASLSYKAKIVQNSTKNKIGISEVCIHFGKCRFIFYMISSLFLQPDVQPPDRTACHRVVRDDLLIAMNAQQQSYKDCIGDR